MAKPNRKMFWASHGFFLFLAGISFRYYGIQGDHLWTDEGGRLSWSIRLRSKVCTHQIKNTSLPNLFNQPWQRLGFENLTFSQRIRMDDPFLFLLYVKQRLCKNQSQVFARVQCRAIGRNSADLTDPGIDLCQAKYSFFEHNAWILPEPGEIDHEYRQWFSYHKGLI